jgi:hypothetical protein
MADEHEQGRQSRALIPTEGGTYPRSFLAFKTSTLKCHMTNTEDENSNDKEEKMEDSTIPAEGRRRGEGDGSDTDTGNSQVMVPLVMEPGSNIFGKIYPKGALFVCK